MSIIPLHLQRRFEQRWAARFGPLKRTTPPSGVSSLGGVAYFKLGPQIPSRAFSAQIVPRFKENHRGLLEPFVSWQFDFECKNLGWQTTPPPPVATPSPSYSPEGA
jgi:hypothetical protein